MGAIAVLGWPAFGAIVLFLFCGCYFLSKVESKAIQWIGSSIILGGFVALGLFKQVFFDWLPGGQERALAYILDCAVEQFTPRLPVAVDESTTIVGVSNSSSALIFDVGVTDRVEEIDIEDAKATLRQAALENSCQDKAYIEVLSRGGMFIYRYEDVEGRKVFDFSLSQKDCDTGFSIKEE